MKIDYEFLKRLLLIMEEDDLHSISNFVLAKSVGLDINGIDDLKFDKFVGHIRLLQDHGCIDCKSFDLGFAQTLNNHWSIYEINYRLTNHGYEFLDILNQSKIFNKIKDLSLSSAFDVGKSLLTNVLSSAIS